MRLHICLIFLCNFIHTYLKTYIEPSIHFWICSIWNHGVRLHLRSCAQFHTHLKSWCAISSSFMHTTSHVFENLHFWICKKVKKANYPAFLMRGIYTTTIACGGIRGSLHTTTTLLKLSVSEMQIMNYNARFFHGFRHLVQIIHDVNLSTFSNFLNIRLPEFGPEPLSRLL